MFSTPIIPTDSLYKFLFVSGIVLMIFGQYLSYTAFRAESEYSTRNAELFSDSVYQASFAERKFQIDSILGRSVVKYESKDNPKKSITFKRLDTSSTNTRKGLTLRKFANDTLHHNNVLTEIYSNSSIGLGFLFTAIGLFGWLIKIQKPQDELLALQVTTAKTQLVITDLQLKTARIHHNKLEKETTDKLTDQAIDNP